MDVSNWSLSFVLNDHELRLDASTAKRALSEIEDAAGGDPMAALQEPAGYLKRILNKMDTTVLPSTPKDLQDIINLDASSLTVESLLTPEPASI